MAHPTSCSTRFVPRAAACPYAVETLRALADRGVLAVEGSRYVVRGALGDFSVPPTIRALVSSRLDRLSQIERRVLFAGAVLGESFSAAGAAAVAGLDEAEATALLDDLVGKALLGFEGDSGSPLPGRYVFLQGVVRRVANVRLSAASGSEVISRPQSTSRGVRNASLTWPARWRVTSW